MAGSSNAPLSVSARLEDYEFLYASNTNVSNFVSVKLSGSNYLLWKAQMLCLLDSYNMCGIVDSTCVGPRDSSTMTIRQYDSLVKGWIFGSVSEDVLVDVFNLGSSKAVWEKLKFMYDPSTSLTQSDSAPTKSDAPQTERKDIDADPSEKNTNDDNGEISIEIVGNDVIPAQTETKTEEMIIKEKANKEVNKKNLREATIKGDWSEVESILKQDKDLATEAISSDGSTILHIAVGIGHNVFLKNLFSYINEEQVLKRRNSDGSTALHIAAIVGNKYAADLLVKKNNKLLEIQDQKGEQALHKACENMHLDTIAYLLKPVTTDDGKTSLTPYLPGDKIGVELLANAFSAKHYKLASELVRNFPEFASKNDHVLLMAIAKTFPPAPNISERLLTDQSILVFVIWKLIIVMAETTFWLLVYVPRDVYRDIKKGQEGVGGWIGNLISYVIITVPMMLMSVVALITTLIVILCFLLSLPCHLLLRAAKILAIPPITHIENKVKECKDAKRILRLICDNIDKLGYCGTHHPYYTRPILEAACQNAYDVVDEILFRSPEAIQSTTESGYDIIQIAIMNRSEKIYNLIYDIGERRNLYRTQVDSSKNNILHLAGRLAPLRELNRRTGAALQFQRELQWFEEVKKLVFPTYITQENIFKETPDMVFTREHQKLLKEGEQWMKTTAESCSITAALITTIVFAAAITVPGGSNQEKGTPLFREEFAFTVFAISDAISLFASSTALLVFLSILTARFAEKDFLVSLPRRLLIGLFTLLLSTTAMMVAFSATLFLVFCERKPWMLAPICGLAFIPIAFFVALQFPLMVDLFRSTHIRTFGKQSSISVLRRFNPDDLRLLFRK